MKVVVSAGGRFHAIHLAHQLQRRNLLKKLYSFSYTRSDKAYVDQNFVHTVNLCKCMDLVFSKLKLARFFNRSIFNSYKDDLFDLIVSEKVKNIGEFDLFVGWANSSLKTLTLAKKMGAISIIESGSCHIVEQNKLIEQEYEKWGVRYKPTCPRVINKMCREYELSDYIMTLSDFSRQSFINQGIPQNKVLKVECGVDVDFFLQNSIVARKTKFRVVFVGMICLRKGVQYLIDAWNKLNLPIEESELLIVGNIQNDFQNVLKNQKLNKNIIFCGSVDRNKLIRIYNRASVFVLPSIEDGFGMVIGEAMASGVPVICTENVGASDIIKGSNLGFVVSSANSQVIAEKVLWCYKNQDYLLGMGCQSKNWIKDFSWSRYGQRVIAAYDAILRSKYNG